MSKTLLALSASLLLAACGGGGGDAGGSAPPAPPPPPAPSFPLPSQGLLSGPTPVASGCTGGGAGGTLFENAEVEPWAAVQPGDPNRLAAAWQQDRWNNGAARAVVSAVSLDGGLAWRRTLHPFSRCGGGTPANGGDYERSSDPWVDIGPSGVIHAMALANSGSAQQPGSVSAMLAQRSLDGGRSWESVQTLVRDTDRLFHDKNALTADRLDARFVYAVWDRLDGSNGPTMLARSTNGGASYEPARLIYTPTAAGGSSPTSSQTIGNRILVLNDGALLNVFTQIDTVAGVSRNWLGAIRSDDKGATWGAPVRIADHLPVGARDPQNSAILIRDGAIIANPAVAPDGRIWLVWQDGRFSSGARDAIALTSSQDGGRSWSAPVAINRRLDVAAFTPAIWVRTDGTLGISHFDLRNDSADPSTLLVDSWLLTSRDGGLSWQEARIWGPFDLAPAPNARGLFIGDYMGLVSRGEQFLPVLALSRADPSNRTDVFALPLLPAATAQAHLSMLLGGADSELLRQRAREVTALQLRDRLSR